MFTFSPHHVISVKVGFLLNKTVYDMKFIVNLIRNDSQKRQKRQKRHILALWFFFPGRACTPRVAKQKTSHGSILPMIYLQFSYVQVKGYKQLFTSEKKMYKNSKNLKL